MDRLNAWEKVEIAREKDRPTSLDYITNIFDDFIELHGDRNYSEDGATICGIAKLDGQNYTIIAQQKGRDTKENIKRNFGMPNPESYKKAIRFIKQSEKFNRPIITFIDTKGAYPGIGAEERGQGYVIAKCIETISGIEVPTISIVIGEGSSGGALAIGVTDKIFMLENSVYSILSPEGFASILWKDATKKKEAAEKMKITAQDLYEMKIIDKILYEPNGNAKSDVIKMSEIIKNNIIETMDELMKIKKEELLDNRYKKYRKIGGC